MALADQYAGRHLGFINPAIYAIGRSSQYHRAFHDITTGNNGYGAGPGFDMVTGLGSPVANRLVTDLAGNAAPPPTIVTAAQVLSSVSCSAIASRSCAGV